MKKWQTAMLVALVLCAASCMVTWRIAVKKEIPDSGSISDIIGNGAADSDAAGNGENTDGGGTETAGDDAQTETEEDARRLALQELPAAAQNQLLCILDNTEVWLKGAGQPLDEEQREVVQKGIWYYMVSDLDQDGRMEIVSSVIEGEEQTSTSLFYEVNETATALIPVFYDLGEDESEPDIIVTRAAVYYDGEKQTYHYIMEDVVRNGATDSYIAKSAVSMQEGSVRNRILMYAKDKPNYLGTYTVYTDSYGNRIRESKYANADRYFPDCERKKASFAWFAAEDEEQLLEQVKMSYKGFSIFEE